MKHSKILWDILKNIFWILQFVLILSVIIFITIIVIIITITIIISRKIVSQFEYT